MTGADDRIPISIGGLRFSVRVPDGFNLVEDDPDYRDFLNQDARLPGEILLPVTLALGGAPQLDGLPVVFDTGTWSAHRRGDETVLRLRSPRGPDPFLWLARVIQQREHPRIAIHCGSLLVERLQGGIRLQNPLHYPLDQLLTMFVLAARRGLVCHAAGIVRDGHGVLFAGPSGAGKTTFQRLCAARPTLEGLSDDRVVVRRVDGSHLVYGTPWAGEGRIAANRAVPLKALVFLHKAERNELRPIAPRQALLQLLPVASILWFDRASLEPAMAYCGELLETLPAYELHFRPEPTVLELLDELF